MNKKQELLLAEWKTTYQGAMHFNDLLMRLRTLGLPAVITITGLAATYGVDKTILPITNFGIGVILISLSIFTSIIIAWLSNRPYLNKKQTPEEWHSVCLSTTELSFWWFIPVITILSTILFWINNHHILNISRDFTLAILLIAFGLVLLFVFYLLDRFYYYSLLIGAIVRLESIEAQLGFEVSVTISRATPRHRSAAVITALYLMPCVVGYLTLLVMLVFYKTG